VDVRIVAATNRDLGAMVQERQFRADLFYRLHVFPIALPALRERLEDIPLLVRHFVQKFAERMNKQIHIIPEGTMEALKRHSWPGNIRELQNFIERAVILSPGTVLCAPLGDLGPDQHRFTELRTSAGAGTLAARGTPAGAGTPASGGTLKEAERAHILDVLRQVNWVVGGNRGAAVRLGLPRTTLLHRMKKLGIAPEEARQNSC
jgi:formate hydrogenlyase transcriptional activator